MLCETSDTPLIITVLALVLSLLPPLSDCESTRSALPRLPSSHEATIDQSCQALRCRLTGRDPSDVVAKRLHESYSRVVIRIFEADAIGLKLIVQSGRHVHQQSGGSRPDLRSIDAHLGAASACAIPNP